MNNQLGSRQSIDVGNKRKFKNEKNDKKHYLRTKLGGIYSLKRWTEKDTSERE